MTFADQDENNNEEVQDVMAETGSEAEGESGADEQCASDKAEGESGADEQCASDKAEGESGADEQCASDKAEGESGVDEQCGADEAAESCDDGCGCSDAAPDAAATAGDFPAASLEMLLMSHHTQAVMALGMMPDPMTGETSANKDAAKFHIDMLSVIEEKTKGNLTSEEAESLSSILHQLRMAFFAS